MSKKRYVGLYCSLIGTLFYILIIFGLIVKLPVKLPTFILLSWPILPGIVSGIIFYKMDICGSWK